MERKTTLRKLDPQKIPHLLEELEKSLPDSIVVSFHGLEISNVYLFNVLRPTTLF
jgi:hypothetical protein